MKARGAGKNFHEIIARNVEGGADSAPPPPALLGLIVIYLHHTFCLIVFFYQQVVAGLYHDPLIYVVNFCKANFFITMLNYFPYFTAQF